MRPPLSDFNQTPFLVFWEVTRACALACKHCRAVAQPKADPQELSHAEALHLIDRLAQLKPPMLVLTGGDPMMRTDIMQLIRAAADKGLHVALSPAATARLIHTDFHALKAAGLKSLSLSLDGANAATHDAFRGVPHTYERTLQAAKAARQAGLYLQINTTVTKSTLAEFDAFTELIQELKPAMWSVFLLVPTGRAAMDELPSAAEVESIWQRLARISRQVDFGVKTTEGHHYRRVSLQFAKQSGQAPPRRSIPTRDGKGVMFISHTGDIQPSGFLPITAGNVRVDDPGDVYRTHPLFVQLRNDNALQGKCGVCEYRTICGGSRARSFAMCGDMMAADPLCDYQPKAFKNNSTL